MTYRAYIEKPDGTIVEFDDIREANRLPTDNVQIITREGARLGVPGGTILRLRQIDDDE